MLQKVLNVVNKTLKQYEVEVNAKFGVTTDALGVILSTEIFKELQGVNSSGTVSRGNQTQANQRTKNVSGNQNAGQKQVVAEFNREGN